jgi:hypothetical protein
MMNTINTVEVRQPVQWLNPPQPAILLARYRLTLRDGETYTLSPSTREVRILSGAACTLDDEREVVLFHGEQLVFTAGQGESVISAVGDETLVFELALDAASEANRQMKRQFYERMAARQQVIEVEGGSGSQR